MIFVDTGFFFALFATEEKKRHVKAHELLGTLASQNLLDTLITTDHVVVETLTLVQSTVKRNAHARAVFIGDKLYSEKLARIHRTTYEEQLEAFSYLKRHADKGYSAVDCLSFVVMLKLGIQEAWSFDGHFSHTLAAPKDQSPELGKLVLCGLPHELALVLPLEEHVGGGNHAIVDTWTEPRVEDRESQAMASLALHDIDSPIGPHLEPTELGTTHANGPAVFHIQVEDSEKRILPRVIGKLLRVTLRGTLRPQPPVSGVGHAFEMAVRAQ